jgi:hypothetical protein
MTDVNFMGLYPKTTAPVNSDKIVTKLEIRQNFYIDYNVSPMKDYDDSRAPRYQDILGAALGPLPGFYLYDVTRSGIPGATGGYFTYMSATGAYQTVLQNTYGYVGRFCMEEGSYMNHQYGLYTFTQVGICYPNNVGTSYPYPYSPVYIGNPLTFTPSIFQDVKGLVVFDSAGNFIYDNGPGAYNNDYYPDQDGVYLLRYTVNNKSDGAEVARFGYHYYPAYKLVVLTP